ncbi:MAG: putative DNA-binding ribbon-helix-helix protein [Alteromonas macleodii]|jgi:predicted DNA-binding ribbon-helix-helix protein
MITIPCQRPAKHSVTLRGHRTSISLEPEFWQEFRDIATVRNQTINGLVIEIDEARVNVGLASAIRVFVLNTLKSERINSAL